VEEVRGAGDHARRLAVGADEDAARLRRRRSGKAVAARKEGEVWHGGGGGGRRRRWPRAGKAKHGAAEEEVEGGGGCAQGSSSAAAERGDEAWRRGAGAVAGERREKIMSWWGPLTTRRAGIPRERVRVRDAPHPTATEPEVAAILSPGGIGSFSIIISEKILRIAFYCTHLKQTLAIT
jgi:hypothetical protein